MQKKYEFHHILEIKQQIVSLEAVNFWKQQYLRINPEFNLI